MTKSQNKKILSYLKQGKKLTALKALSLFDCMRLSSRISDLKDEGHKIKVKMVKTNTGKQVAEYSL